MMAMFINIYDWLKSYFVPSTHLHFSVSESLNYYAAKYRELHEI